MTTLRPFRPIPAQEAFLDNGRNRDGRGALLRLWSRARGALSADALIGGGLWLALSRTK
jgi:hypothetical protein